MIRWPDAAVLAGSGRDGSGSRRGRPRRSGCSPQRDFTAGAPDQVWLTDITEHPTSQGKVYCCAIKDVFSNRIVGYAIDERMTAQLAVLPCVRQSPGASRPASWWSTATAARNFEPGVSAPS